MILEMWICTGHLFTLLQNQNGNLEIQYFGEAILAIQLCLSVQMLGYDLCLELHESYHQCFGYPGCNIDMRREIQLSRISKSLAPKMQCKHDISMQQ